MRNTLIEIKKRNEQIIDIISKDKVLINDFDPKTTEKAQNIIKNFKNYIEKK